MPVIRKPPVKKEGVMSSAPKGLKESALKVFDIHVDRLVMHDSNPNEQSEKTFDEIVNRIRTSGFDEPIIVVPEIKKGIPTQKFLILSGHHRVKAAKVCGMTMIPAVIREGWDEDRVLIELVSRNQLRGNLNPHKFTELWSKLEKRYEPEVLKRMMGLTEKKAFEALFKQIRDQLPPKAKKKLDEAKEKVNSVEDLSFVINEIFKNHGSEVDHSFMVFTYGGKHHHYIQIDGQTNKMVTALKERMEGAGVNAGQFFKDLLSNTVQVDNVIGKLRHANQSEAASAPDKSEPRRAVRRPPPKK